MFDFQNVILYVEDITVSKHFYTDLLERSPEDLSATFSSFTLDSGMKLELKQRKESRTPATVTGGGAELCMSLPDADALNRLYETWKGKGIAFAQTPTRLVFGFTFVALDPDGHRLRVVTDK